MATKDLQEFALPEYREKRIRPDWALSNWADRILEEAGVGVTILDRDGVVIYYNRWAALYMDRQPSYIDDDVRNRHGRAITNPRLDAMFGLFEEGRTEPVRYVAHPPGMRALLVTVSPIHQGDELVGFSQLVLFKEEVQELCQRFDAEGRKPFEKDMLPDGWEPESPNS